MDIGGCDRIGSVGSAFAADGRGGGGDDTEPPAVGDDAPGVTAPVADSDGITFRSLDVDGVVTYRWLAEAPGVEPEYDAVSTAVAAAVDG